jgi:ubiquinone/menaquinone biosynthesis C-methylase UbiE
MVKMTDYCDKEIKEIVSREKTFYESFYKEAYRSHARFNFQVPVVWIEKAKNPDSRPLDYWEYSFHLLGDLRGKKVAEIGCGDGWITTCLAKAGAAVYALDVSVSGCRLTKEKLKAHGLSPGLVAVMDAHSLAFQSSTFDAVFIAGVLHHLNLEQVSREFHRILKEKGKVVSYEPLRYGPLMLAIRKIWLKINGIKEYVSTEDEEPLKETDLNPFLNVFKNTEIRKFNFIAKTNRLRNRFGTVAKILRFTDYVILSLFPFLNKYCTCIVCRFEK